MGDNLAIVIKQHDVPLAMYFGERDAHTEIALERVEKCLNYIKKFRKTYVRNFDKFARDTLVFLGKGLVLGKKWGYELYKDYSEKIPCITSETIDTINLNKETLSKYTELADGVVEIELHYEFVSVFVFFELEEDELEDFHVVDITDMKIGCFDKIPFSKFREVKNLITSKTNTVFSYTDSRGNKRYLGVMD